MQGAARCSAAAPFHLGGRGPREVRERCAVACPGPSEAPVGGGLRRRGLFGRAGPSHVERRLARGIAVGPEAARVELVAQGTARALDRGPDRYLVLAGTRRTAIAEQVIALGVGLDARGRLVERGGDLRPVLVQDGP